MSGLDALFIGSSPNALAGAARLAKAGGRVAVVDTSHVVGGPVATDEFAPGFRADTGVAAVALDPDIARELGVSVDVIRRDTVTSLDGGGGPPVTLRAAPELPEAFNRAVEILRGLHRTEPPDLPALSVEDVATLGVLGGGLRSLGARALHEVLRLTFLSARDFLDENVPDPATRALLAGVAVRGLSEGPFAQGTLFGLVHRAALDDALFRSTARGGVRSVAEALAATARAAGVEIHLGAAGPITVELAAGVAQGVRLGDGTLLEADRVVSDLDVKATLTQLVRPYDLDPEVNRAVRALRYRGTVARVHLALREFPAFRGVGEDAMRGTLVVSRDVASIERAWDDAKRGSASRAPYVEITIPSIADPSLAPPGQHVLDAWVQHVPYGRGDRAQVRKSVLDAIAAWCPRIVDLVLHDRVALPQDLEARFGVAEGQLDGGEVRLDQAFFLRPLPGWSHHRTPIGRLYLGGSAAHPGGYSGRSGWNLAGQFLSTRPAG